MYAARSAFLHGSAQLPPNGVSWDAPKAIEGKLKKIHSAEDIAIAVLISSLQKLATEGWSILEFSEDVIGSEEAQEPEDAIIGSSIPCVITSEIEKWMIPFIRRFE